MDVATHLGKAPQDGLHRQSEPLIGLTVLKLKRIPSDDLLNVLTVMTILEMFRRTSNPDKFFKLGWRDIGYKADLEVY